MSTMTFELADEQVDGIVVSQLAWHRDMFIQDIAACEKNEGMAIFDTDRKKDLKQLKKHLKAFNLVLKYYGEPKE
jgi:hypothetical protein